jgi:hypothetical protein
VEAHAGDWNAALSAARRAVASPPVANDSILALTVALSYSGHCDEARTTEAALAKRLKDKMPKDVAAVLDESHKACSAERTDTAKR